MEAASPELQAATAAVEAARVELAAARELVEGLVADLADDHAALTTGPDAAATRQALVRAMTDALQPADSRLAGQAAQGRPVLRPSRARILIEEFSGPATKATSLDDRFVLWCATRVANQLAARTKLDGVDQAEIERLLDRLFEPGESWYEFWNRSFHVDLPAAETYAAAVRSYEEAGLALDRLRRPERYGPRGELAPPGMIIVPGGDYVLGPSAGWPRPRREVRLEPFALDRHEVTCREYAAFVDSLRNTPDLQELRLPRGWTVGRDGRAVYDESLRQHPVVHVDWLAAAHYAEWAGKRLPTEDECEAAAAGPDGRAWPWGNEFGPGRANGAGAAEGTLPVESFPGWPSEQGAQDLAGNVWEWTSTLDDGTDVTSLPAGLVNVVIRGGGWRSPRDELTTRFRWTAQGKETFASPNYDRPIGFRCAKDL